MPISNGPRDLQKLSQRLDQSAHAAPAAPQISAERARAIMDERARALAQPPPAPPSASEVLEVLSFRVGRENYALQTTYVRGVMQAADIIPVPGAPEMLQGVVNLRGDVLAIMDLSRLLGVAPPELPRRPWVVVLGTEQAELGLLAHAVEEVVRLQIDQLQDPGMPGGGDARQYVRGVTRQALVVLDGAALLDDPQLWIDQSEEY